MSHRLVGLIFSCACLLRSPSAAADVLLHASKGWLLDYADAQCLASREYGTPDGPVTLAFRPAPNGATYEIFVLRKSPSPMFAEELEGSVDFGRGPIKAWLLHYRIVNNRLDAYQYRISAPAMAQARNAVSVSLQIKGRSGVSFSLESIPALLDGLDACTADLKRYWNMDGSQVASIAVPAKGDVRSIFKSEDYPSDALMRSQEGTSQYLLLIDETGRVAACHVALPSGVPELDSMGCVVIQGRAKFKPARDREGKPIRSTVVTPPITWRLM